MDALENASSDWQVVDGIEFIWNVFFTIADPVFDHKNTFSTSGDSRDIHGGNKSSAQARSSPDGVAACGAPREFHEHQSSLYLVANHQQHVATSQWRNLEGSLRGRRGRMVMVEMSSVTQEVCICKSHLLIASQLCRLCIFDLDGAHKQMKKLYMVDAESNEQQENHNDTVEQEYGHHRPDFSSEC